MQGGKEGEECALPVALLHSEYLRGNTQPGVLYCAGANPGGMK